MYFTVERKEWEKEKKRAKEIMKKNRINNNTTSFDWTFNYLYTSHLEIYNNAFVQYFATCKYGLAIVYSKLLYDFVFQKTNTNTNTDTPTHTHKILRNLSIASIRYDNMELKYMTFYATQNYTIILSVLHDYVYIYRFDPNNWYVWA